MATNDTDRDRALDVPPDEQIADALAWVREEYDNSFPEWRRFAADADEHRPADCRPTFQTPDVHMLFVRWRSYGVETLTRSAGKINGDIMPGHLWAVVELYQDRTDA